MRYRRGGAWVGTAILWLVGCGGTSHDPDSKGKAGGSGGDVAQAGSGAQQAGQNGAASEGGTSSGGVLATGGNSQSGSAGVTTSGGAAGSQGSAGAAGAAGTKQGPTLESCTPWEVIKAPQSTSTATLVDGALYLARPGGPPDSGGFFGSNGIDVVQQGLTGDFDIVVSFEAFVQGDTAERKGPYFNAGVYTAQDDGSLARGAVGMQLAALVLRVGNMGRSNYSLHVANATWLENASGSFEFRRQGTDMTATVTIGAASESETSPLPFDAEPLSLFIGIGNNDEEVGMQESSIKITSVEVTGGGGAVKSDSFDCK